ncbi:MAG: DUF2442 domain-containing protein [Clostridium cochlearium]|jgi:hypothetical protein|uniref:DUF2442 domain-containing protein n=1 Tax=Clostridium cochlearium TaxID=1494 RepID=A0ABY0QLE8_CLOCO|nr:DUF2442 domain-containing protein [Clostridium cochlearium]MDU1442510.1 DUF2442 domain-containing protein [Clostridium cochlearium]SDL15405.1 Protein of unknown function [Clostridium cochlearium]
MQNPDIIKAKVLKDYKLIITFSNNEKKIFDMNPYLKYPVFKPLYNKDEFENFSIVDGTIEWNCGADLSNDTFYIRGIHFEESLLEM